MRNGVELAVSEINALGGYVGASSNWWCATTRPTPNSRQMSEELVKEGVLATIGFCNSGNAVKSLDIYQKARVPLIVPCATGTPITSTIPAAESYVFRTSARSLQVPFVVNEVVRRGWTRVAVLADSTGYGNAGLEDFTKALAAHNSTRAAGRFDIGVKDMTDAVKAARDSSTLQVLFTITVGPENAVIARTREALELEGGPGRPVGPHLPDLHRHQERC